MIYLEFLISAGVGFLLSAIIIFYSPCSANETKKLDEIDDINIEEDKKIASVNIYLDEEKVLQKTKFIQNTMGISPNLIQEAVRKTNLELKNGTPVNEIELMSSFSVLFDSFVAVVVFLVSFYCLNVLSKGELGRIAAGLFQTELESFNFDKLPFQYIFKSPT